MKVSKLFSQQIGDGVYTILDDNLILNPMSQERKRQRIREREKEGDRERKRE